LVVDPAKRIEWNDLLAYDLNIKKEVLKQISLDD
jgi:hypothetical protein